MTEGVELDSPTKQQRPTITREQADPIIKVWEQSIGEWAESIVYWANEKRRFSRNVVLYPKETQLPWRITLKPTGKDQLLPIVYVHLNEFRGRGETKTCYTCLELDQEKVIRRAEIRSPLKDALHERNQAQQLASKHIDMPLLLVRGKEDEHEFMCTIKPLLDRTLNELADLDLTCERRLGILRDITKTLADAHGKGRVCLDVKGDNFMLHLKTGEVKFVDLGLVQEMGTEERSGRRLDLCGLRDDILPTMLPTSVKMDGLARGVVDWIKHRLDDDALQADMIETTDLVHTFDLARLLAPEEAPEDGEVMGRWKQIGERSRLELLRFFIRARVGHEKRAWMLHELGVEWNGGNGKKEIGELAELRLKILMQDREESLEQLLDVGPACFFRADRQALRTRLADKIQPRRKALHPSVRTCLDWFQVYGKRRPGLNYRGANALLRYASLHLSGDRESALTSLRDLSNKVRGEIRLAFLACSGELEEEMTPLLYALFGVKWRGGGVEQHLEALASIGRQMKARDCKALAKLVRVVVPTEGLAPHAVGPMGEVKRHLDEWIGEPERFNKQFLIATVELALSYQREDPVEAILAAQARVAEALT